MHKILLKQALVINRGTKEYKDILIKAPYIERVDADINEKECEIVDLKGKWVIPGIIDDQVHFREPGYTHKADIYTESRAALLGGVTSFMEMPNTNPPAASLVLLEDKYEIASRTSVSNYSFYVGATNDNLDELLKADDKKICGIKIFMGSSTGNLLVDDHKALDKIFENAHMLIATHCEDETTIRRNLELYKRKYGAMLSPIHHPEIRSAEGCYLSSSYAVELAEKHGTRLHVLHITTERELELFEALVPLEKKRITAEVCVHHLFFNDKDYEQLGNRIKCNPAIKTKQDQQALFQGLLNDKLDIVAADHAPHTLEEKSAPYALAPSGLPLIQHSLSIMLDFYHRGKISLEEIVRKMCHAPADCFSIDSRGYLDEGSFADIVIIDPNEVTSVNSDNIAYKCGWSPLEGRTFTGSVEQVYVNGILNVDKEKIVNDVPGKRLTFNR